jgi:hypothetical protein
MNAKSEERLADSKPGPGFNIGGSQWADSSMTKELGSQGAVEPLDLAVVVVDYGAVNSYGPRCPSRYHEGVPEWKATRPGHRYT